MKNRSISRRARDLSVLAPILGLALLSPPFVSLFAAESTVFGAPLILVYLFSVWLGLIATAALLARRLDKPEKSSDA